MLRQYSQIFKVKIYSGTDNFQTKIRQFELHVVQLKVASGFNQTGLSKILAQHTFCKLFAYSLRSFEASCHVLNNTDLTSNRINYLRILSVATQAFPRVHSRNSSFFLTKRSSGALSFSSATVLQPRSPIARYISRERIERALSTPL